MKTWLTSKRQSIADKYRNSTLVVFLLALGIY